MGAVLLLAALAVTLSHSEARRSGTNYVKPDAGLGPVPDTATVCQDDELIPADTGAIRIGLRASAAGAPRSARVAVRAGGRTIARGAVATGWRAGELATLQLRPVLRDDVRGRVCIALGSGPPPRLVGAPVGPESAARAGGRALAGQMRLVYLRPGRESWWALAGTIAHRVGLGHAVYGPSLLLAALLILAALGLGAWQLLARTDT